MWTQQVKGKTKDIVAETKEANEKDEREKKVSKQNQTETKNIKLSNKNKELDAMQWEES